MLPGIGTPELVVIAVVALLVVGPKDLPIMLRKLGQFTAKMRGLASEFRASFDEMARQSELDELRKEVEALREGRFADGVKSEIDAHMAGFTDTHHAWDGSYLPPEVTQHLEPAGGNGHAAEPELPLLAHDDEPELPFDAPPPVHVAEPVPVHARPAEAQPVETRA